MISGVWTALKSMKNQQKSRPDWFGTPENRPGWAGFAGLAGEVVVELANGRPNSIRIANKGFQTAIKGAGRGHLRAFYYYY